MPYAVAAAAVVGLGSAYMQSESADDAANSQSNAAGKSIAEQRRQADQARQDNAPFLKTGTAANRRLQELLGLGSGADVNDPRFKEVFEKLQAQKVAQQREQTGHSAYDDWETTKEERSNFDRALQDEAERKYVEQYGRVSDSGELLRKFSATDMEADPVYQSGLKFGLDRGTEGINSRALAGGMYDSGATLKALTQFGSDYGSTKANESYNRFTNDQSNIFNKLSGISGTGQVASNQIAASGSNAANQIGQSLEGAGNARAAAIVGGSNAWGNAAAGIGNAYNNYNSNNTLQALLKKQQQGGSSPYGYSEPTSNFDYSGYTSAGGNQYG